MSDDIQALRAAALEALSRASEANRKVGDAITALYDAIDAQEASKDDSPSER